MKPRLLIGILLVSLAKASPAQITSGALTLEGQVVCCKDCWLKADRRKTPYGSPEDLAQAEKCIAKGDPTLLAVMNQEGKTSFYQLEDGRFTLPGPNWLDYVGSRVEISGPTRVKKTQRFIRVDALKVVAAPEKPPAPQVIGRDVDLALKDLLGAEQKLSSYRGRIVVLNFWATWCLPCKKEMPDLGAIQNQYAAYGVQVIGASADGLGELERVRQFIKDAAINFPVWLGATAEQMAQFGLGPGLPGTAIIGGDGKIFAVYRTVVTREAIRKNLDKLLAEGTREAKLEQTVAKVEPRPAASTVPS